jgi:hypothetical protein
MRACAFILLVVLAMSSSLAPRAARARQAAPTPKEAAVSIELDDLPGRDSAGSYWEVSYQLRIADQEPFINWSEGGEDPNELNKLGILVSKNSFTRRDLSRPENRRFSVSIPLAGELLARFRDAGRRKQYVWMDGMARIHDAKLGRDFAMKIGPVWGPRRFVTGVYNVHLDLSQAGELQMTSDNGNQGGKTVFTRP